MTTLGTSNALSLTLSIPKTGDWRADVLLDNSPLPTGKTTLTVGDLSLACSVLRSDFDAAGKPHAVVVGAIGWQNLVTKPLSFNSSAGVRLSSVLSAISQGSGQTIVQPTDRTIGDHYELGASRPGEPVRWVDALNDLVRAGYLPLWRVDPDGVTRFTPRTSAAVSVRATLMRHDSSIGLFVYGLDAPAQFLPGNTVEGTPIGKLVLREHRGKLEADVYSDDLTKSAPPIRELLRRLLPDSPEHRAQTYVVNSVNTDGTLNVVPTADAQHLPEINNVEQWTVGGIQYHPLPGTEVAIIYRGKNKTRPIAFAFPLDVNPFSGVARLGDTVTVLLPPATFTGTIGGVASSGIVVWAPGQTIGTITTSSARTKAGP
jgi:hypothetical protein